MSTYEISKSSLLSLKAEILRKQDELSKHKQENTIKLKNLQNSVPLDLKTKIKDANERPVDKLTEEEENLLTKSKSALENKAKLYDKLMRKNHSNLTEEEIEQNRRYLVRFDKKSKLPDLPPDDEDDTYRSSSDDDGPTHSYDPPTNSDEEWVEYVDCLGRTRTCLRKDLAYLKSKEKDLKSTVEAKKKPALPTPPREPSRSRSPSPEEPSESSELLSADMRRELSRRQWEKEEEELRDKSNIHYQDVLFNEARSHGVGYYGFSKDEEERARQQAALKNLRAETMTEQKKSQNMKAQRAKLLKARVLAAKNRKRARIGLPPLEEEKEKTPEPEPVVVETEKPDEKAEMRKTHIRPWDREKEGVKKEHLEYSQEEWVDKKRRERNNEFAPPSAYQREFHSSVKATYRTREEKQYNRATSKKIDPVPIVNELSDGEDDEMASQYRNGERTAKHFNSAERGRGAEIAPPATFEYYGPSSSKRPKRDKSGANISDSIEAGLRFIREQLESQNR